MGDVSEESYTDAMDALRDAACDAFSGDDHHPGFFRIVNAADRLQAAAHAEGRHMERAAIVAWLRDRANAEPFPTELAHASDAIERGEHEKGERG